MKIYNENVNLYVCVLNYPNYLVKYNTLGILTTKQKILDLKRNTVLRVKYSRE